MEWGDKCGWGSSKRTYPAPPSWLRKGNDIFLTELCGELPFGLLFMHGLRNHICIMFGCLEGTQSPVLAEIF